MADVTLAMSRKPPPDPVKLGAPALSPDGRLAVLGVSFERGYSHLVIFDVHREELQVVGKPDDEGWRDPSFSPFPPIRAGWCISENRVMLRKSHDTSDMMFFLATARRSGR